MAKPRKYPILPEGLKEALRLAHTTTTCPKCGQPGLVSVLPRGYLVIRHMDGSTHMVPADKVVPVLAQVREDLLKVKEAIEKALTAVDLASQAAKNPTEGFGVEDRWEASEEAPEDPEGF